MSEIHKDSPNSKMSIIAAFISTALNKRRRLLNGSGFGFDDAERPKTLVVGNKPDDCLVISDQLDHGIGGKGVVDLRDAINN